MMRAVAFRLALGPSASNGACCSFTILNRGKRLFCSADEVDSIKAEKVDDGYKFKFTTPYEAHRLPATPRNEAVTTRDELLAYYREMFAIRRMEIACDQLYKQKLIRGFLHLYTGQEAVCVGIEHAITRDDAIITAYRDHGFMYSRGGSAEGIIAELLGKKTGSSKGKGGSMHIFHCKNNFFGGNGIVGAQVPVGAGIAFALKYHEKPNICIAAYGDGAANQGQVYEAFNMAALWKLPVVFVCENNKYGMGTSAQRAAAVQEFFTRGDYIPGLKVDGMDVLAVREAMKFAKDFSLKNGPILLEMNTYRYVGHSMSDPGTSYRTRNEVSKVRETRDPINAVKTRLINNEIATEEEVKAIEKEAKAEIDAAVNAAKEAPEPELEESYTEVLQELVPVRGRELGEMYSPA